MFVKRKINIILCIIFFVLSCSRNDSSTNFKDVFIYTSIEDRGDVIKIVNNGLLDFEYHTPIPQKRYTSSWKNISEFTQETEHSLLMVISLDDGVDTLSGILANHLTQNSSNNITLVNDYYAEDQLLFILKYEDSDDFSMDLALNKDWILSKLKENDFKNLKKYSFRSGLNDSIVSRCKEMFDLDMEIQKDYQIIKENFEDNYLWVGRGYPYRWIFIYEDTQRHYTSNRSVYRRLDQHFSEILDVNALPYEAKFDIIKTPDDEIRKIYGLYGTKMESENVTGGPFVSYIFDKPESNRVLIASGFVNFPGKNKVFHIKELEYILETAKLNKTTKE